MMCRKECIFFIFPPIDLLEASHPGFGYVPGVLQLLKKRAQSQPSPGRAAQLLKSDPEVTTLLRSVASVL